MKHLVMRVCIGIAILVGTPIQQAVVAAEKEDLTFAVIRTEEMSVLAGKWEKLLEQVEKARERGGWKNVSAILKQVKAVKNIDLKEKKITIDIK